MGRWFNELDTFFIFIWDTYIHIYIYIVIHALVTNINLRAGHLRLNVSCGKTCLHYVIGQEPLLQLIVS